MVPIGDLSMKRLAAIGQAGKLWRWKRSHHQWLLQFKWKWQKPWKLSELIKHSDETIMRSRPRAQALINVMWWRVQMKGHFYLWMLTTFFQHGLTRVRVITGNLYRVVSHAYYVLSLQFLTFYKCFWHLRHPSSTNVFCNYFSTLTERIAWIYVNKPTDS